jgi:hypothetical protein
MAGLSLIQHPIRVLWFRAQPKGYLGGFCAGIRRSTPIDIGNHPKGIVDAKPSRLVDS